MRQTILAAAAAFVIGGASIGALVSHAQPAPPPPGPDGGPGGGPAGMHHPGWMAWRHHMHDGMRDGRRPAPGTFALVHRQADRNLAPPDVQKIAEALLLWNGNHAWKVVNVAATSDGAIGFSLATQEGSVIAQFTMDPHTGHVTRTG